ncbi:molecular chaperone [Providencia stuartii]|uniref:fimbrial biogenesis chaperone n=1 Tax=Providencia stuartii TaxID=588 RepID=UPI0014952BEE|nr:molecular chaperone [Providencia stuartii]NPD41229.1 molecular chaperone [Providencia stuartii]NPD96229.1 molecular chaperone [Providencia stuartii]
MITRLSIINKIVLFISLFIVSTSMYASVIINGTRVIYNEKSKSKTVRLVNDNKWPALVQVWLDNGDPNELPENIKTPFSITPPIFKMSAGAGQNLRLTYLGDSLPKDKESIFYLNVLEIPPENEDTASQNKNTMQIAIRTRVKLFYRPTDIKMPAQVNEKLSFSIKKTAKGNELLVKNNSPWFITFQDVTLSEGNRKLSLEGNMVAPFSDIYLNRGKGVAIPNDFINAKKVSYSVINDYGGLDSYESNL